MVKFYIHSLICMVKFYIQMRVSTYKWKFYIHAW